MEYVFRVNKSSTDARVGVLTKSFTEAGFQVLDFNEPSPQPAIYFIEPRAKVDPSVWQNLVKGSLIFGYQPTMPEMTNPNGQYISLNLNEAFIQSNNRLTAQAMQQILKQNSFTKKKMLICGWGKLATALVTILKDWDISILNFNHHKQNALQEEFGAKAYYETAPFADFPVIINTIPKPLLKPATWPKKRPQQIIYDLASAPFGFDWSGVEPATYNYQILPGLPGKYFPQQAATIVYNAIQQHLSALQKPAIVWCLTGSACSFPKILPVLQEMVATYDVYPVMSPNALLPNRFLDIEKLKQAIQNLTGHQIITTIAGAETLSSNPNLQASVIFPATGNTIAKLTYGITDTCVLMAVKALLRNRKPCVIGLATNDALSNNAKNIGELLNRRDCYFVPFGQDNINAKPFSCVCDFSKVMTTITTALKGQQLQPILECLFQNA